MLVMGYIYAKGPHCRIRGFAHINQTLDMKLLASLLTAAALAAPALSAFAAGETPLSPIWPRERPALLPSVPPVTAQMAIRPLSLILNWHTSIQSIGQAAAGVQERQAR
jgi:hypothetical protein